MDSVRLPDDLSSTATAECLAGGLGSAGVWMEGRGDVLCPNSREDHSTSALSPNTYSLEQCDKELSLIRTVKIAIQLPNQKDLSFLDLPQGCFVTLFKDLKVLGGQRQNPFLSLLRL